LANEGIEVNVNFFAEKHGKFGPDQHFSIISWYLKRESSKQDIMTVDEIAEVLNQCHDQSNNIRINESKEIIRSITLVLNPDNYFQKYTKHSLNIRNLTCFYNLQSILHNGNFELNSTVFSYLKEFINPSKIISTTDYVDNEIINYPPPNTNKMTQINYQKGLKTKRKRIKILLNNNFSAEQLKQIDHDSMPKQTLNDEFSVDIVSPSTSSAAIKDNNKSSDTQMTPKYCSESCSKCLSIPLYKIKDLHKKNEGRRLITGLDIIDELGNHQHKKSLKIGKRWRTVEEASLELAEHYRKFHKVVV
jgi:hypothetical protein